MPHSNTTFGQEHVGAKKLRVSLTNRFKSLSLPLPLECCPPRLVIFFKHEPDGMVPYANYACHSPINHSADPPEPELSLTYLFFRLK